MRILAAAAAAAFAISAAVPASSDVNVYSYRQPELVEPLFTAFTDATGIQVNVTFLDKGMVERLKAEGMRSPADIIMTVDISRLSAAVAEGVTQSVSSDVLTSSIPSAFRDPGGHWHALTLRGRIVYASKERVGDGEVTTYEDLANGKWAGRLCSRLGTHPYNLALFGAMISRKGEAAAKEWIAALKRNLGRKPQGNDRAQVKAIWAGECDISLGNTYYMGKMLTNEEQQAWANSVRIVFPVFEGGGTHMNVSGVAMTKAAPNREEAMKLMEFLASPEAQRIYAAVNYEYPVTPGVAASDLVASWGEFVPDGLPLAEIARQRPAALRMVEEVGFDD